MRIAVQRRDIYADMRSLVLVDRVIERGAIAKFWSAVVQPSEITVQTRNKLKFNDNSIQWGWERGSVGTLYIRECYRQAVNTIKDYKTIVVLGTPGIGKSIFIFYLVYVLVRRAIRKKVEIPTFELSDRDKTRYFLTVVEGKGVVMSDGDIPDYVITDTVARPNAVCTKKYIHVTSLHNENMKDLWNSMAASEDSTDITFPVFSRDEYLESDGTESNTVCLY